VFIENKCTIILPDLDRAITLNKDITDIHSHTGYWILDASQTDPPSDLPNRQFGERA